MDVKKKRRISVANIGHNVPSNLKFAVLVAAAVLWANFLRTALADLISLFYPNASLIIVDFLIALLMTLLAIVILFSYTKLRNWLKDLKI